MKQIRKLSFHIVAGPIWFVLQAISGTAKLLAFLLDQITDAMTEVFAVFFGVNEPDPTSAEEVETPIDPD